MTARAATADSSTTPSSGQHQRQYPNRQHPNRKPWHQKQPSRRQQTRLPIPSTSPASLEPRLTSDTRPRVTRTSPDTSTPIPATATAAATENPNATPHDGYQGVQAAKSNTTRAAVAATAAASATSRRRESESFSWDEVPHTRRVILSLFPLQFRAFLLYLMDPLFELVDFSPFHFRAALPAPTSKPWHAR